MTKVFLPAKIMETESGLTTFFGEEGDIDSHFSCSRIDSSSANSLFVTTDRLLSNDALLGVMRNKVL